MSLTQEIESRIQTFVKEVNELVRREALAAVSAALGASVGSPAVRRPPGRPPKAMPGAVAGSPAPAVPSRRRARRKGEKRAPEELLALERALFDHVKGNPGQGIEMIGRALGLTTSELARPMKKMVSRGDMRTVGVKRATKYFVADGASGPSTGAGPRGGRGAGRGRRKKRSAKK